MQREGWLGVGLFGAVGCSGLLWLVTRDAETRMVVSAPPGFTTMEQSVSTSEPPSPVPLTTAGAAPYPSAVGESSTLQRNEAMVREDDESITMARLRELRFSNPDETLALISDADKRFGGSPSTPERRWFQARSLVELQRFDEAKAVAQRTIERYPNDAFALDLRRHLLSYPLGLSPRAY